MRYLTLAEVRRMVAARTERDREDVVARILRMSQEHRSARVYYRDFGPAHDLQDLGGELTAHPVREAIADSLERMAGTFCRWAFGTANKLRGTR